MNTYMHTYIHIYICICKEDVLRTTDALPYRRPYEGLQHVLEIAVGGCNYVETKYTPVSVRTCAAA